MRVDPPELTAGGCARQPVNSPPPRCDRRTHQEPRQRGLGEPPPSATVQSSFNTQVFSVSVFLILTPPQYTPPSVTAPGGGRAARPASRRDQRTKHEGPSRGSSALPRDSPLDGQSLRVRRPDATRAQVTTRKNGRLLCTSGIPEIPGALWPTHIQAHVVYIKD